MNNLSLEAQEFLNLLEKKEKMVAMLAPSFPIVFSHPQIVAKLKKLGFIHVVEVSRGAMETNRQLLEFLKSNPKKRLITSPCPAVVRMIKKRFPHLVQFLAPVDSPMVATAKLVKEKYSDCRPVFIGPCPVKKLEAKEDHPELNILVLIYKEMEEILKEKNIKQEPDDVLATFDLIGKETRLFPISGGLAQSSGLSEQMTDEELDVVSGIKIITQALNSFPTNRLKVLDILFCEGGCIAGQGIESSLSLDEKRTKIIGHWAKVFQPDDK